MQLSQVRGTGGHVQERALLQGKQGMRLKRETSANLDLGLSLQALVLYIVAPGCKPFHLVASVSKFCSLPLSHFRAFLVK